MPSAPYSLAALRSGLPSTPGRRPRAVRRSAVEDDMIQHGEANGGRLKKKGSPEYLSWHNMKQRCRDPRHRSYPNYGGRGITVCDRWLHDFQVFLADMGRRPTMQHCIDRIDTNGPYEKSNCRWATRKQQARNRRTNHVLAFDGHHQTLTAWAEETGIGKATLRQRLKRGWTLERTLYTPVGCT